MSNSQKKPELSLVVPCLNGATTIADLLESLANQEWSKPWEIIIADNGSTDRTLEIVAGYERRLPNLRVVDASGRKGAPHALNVGVRSARAENIASCDADDVVGRDYIRAIGEALQKHDFVACRLDMKRLNPEWITAGRKFPQDTGVQTYSYPPFLPHAGGGTIGVKRRLWESVGGLDETLPYLYETDFCWKLQLAGTKLEFIPDAIIHVRLRHHLKPIFRQACSWGEYNVVLYKRYRTRGMPTLSPRAGVAAWMQILRSSRRYRSMRPGERAQYVWALAWRWGRLKSSLKNKVFAL